MNQRKKLTGHPRLYSAGGFSNRSMGSSPKISTTDHVTPVTFNKSLLDPLNLEVDPAVQVLRTQEKEQIKSLNNRFVSYIEKVRLLEQQNKLLETKWSLLQGNTTNPSEVEPLYKEYIGSLQRHLDLLNNNRLKLDTESKAIHQQVDDFTNKLGDETTRRNDAENEYVKLKKDVDAGLLATANNEATISSLKEELYFYKIVYDEELKELKDSVKGVSVVVEMDNSRDLNMDQIVSNVWAQYEDIAAHSRAETEIWYRTKMDQMTTVANQYGNELHTTKQEVANLKQQIKHLQHEIEKVSMQHEGLKESLFEMEARGEQSVLDATARIKDLEEALKKAKLDMLKQIKEYQKLLDIKLALDLEISTYRKMLEGEENR
ncbi:intermediate filament protein ON3 [Nematolebias whitei]|uniref:intermediate filament protein ON3 n=1 Tax=Nematolebias whitei TaxID=451745 RepID=UPI001896ECC4|nr:intermediate filament protein ON3 [Nematolebias whitei]